MGLISSIKRFFKSALRRLWGIINNVFSGALEVFLAEFIDIAKVIVKDLVNSDFTSEEKRTEAFSRIRNKVVVRNARYKDSWINLLIEISCAAVKKEFNG